MRLIALALALASTLVACGGSSDPAPAPAPAPSQRSADHGKPGDDPAASRIGVKSDDNEQPGHEMGP